MPASSRTVKGIQLECTSWKDPERYHAWMGDKLVAIFRMNIGLFRAIDAQSDGLKVFFDYVCTGHYEFDCEEERTKVLTLAVDALLAKYPPPITSMF